MNDIIKSLNKALISQRWSIDATKYGVGHPFEWVDGNNRSFLYDVEGSLRILQYLSMNNENTFPIPDEIVVDDYEEMKNYISKVINEMYEHFFPFVSAKEFGYSEFIDSTITARIQDYCFIKKVCTLSNNINHLDMGPGLGSHFIYSSKAFNSCFYALEASPHSYSVQRSFFRFMSASNNYKYLDVVDCENLCSNQEMINHEINSSGKYRIKHVPSWYFPSIDGNTIDLVTATWMLNEITFSGVLWLLANASRILRKGGYFYIRDSGTLKENRHRVNYDDLLVKMGFVLVKRLDVTNRVDYFGIPRVYRKETDKSYSYDELVKSLQWSGVFTP